MIGWIKIHREIQNHWIYQDDRYFKWWITILLNVNHTAMKFPVNGELVTCNPGESFRSINEWCGLFDCHKKTLYKFFSLCESDKMITRKTAGKGNRRKHLLTVVNWDKFQQKETEKCTEKDTENVPLIRMINNDQSINDIFEEFRVKYPGEKRGKKTELTNFLKKSKPEIVFLLMPALNKEIRYKEQQKTAGIFCAAWPHLQTWINQKRWETEFPIIAMPSKQKSAAESLLHES